MMGAASLPIATLPMATRAQQQTARIGVLSPFSRATSAAWHDAFQRGLKDYGWTEGTNLAIDYRFAYGRTDRLAQLVAEPTTLKVDVLVTDETLAPSGAGYQWA